MDKKILRTKIDLIIEKYPFIQSFFDDNNIAFNKEHSIEEIFSNLSEEELEDIGTNRDDLLDNFKNYFELVSEALSLDDNLLSSITILPGTNKKGEAENFDEIKLFPGDIISIVGPTGSGKSRLLADIEWMANKDTPTNRTILINDKEPDRELRFKTGSKLVAQLSQNMNFVMDLTVEEFITIHAESRLVEDIELKKKQIIEKANQLAGEQFELTTPITSLSGGQSRALMIADTAILSKSPIVLIDEIENAGIDRKRALDILIGEEKIVLISTHDPILSLMSKKRLIIENGGIKDVILIDEEEKKSLDALVKLDDVLMKQREKLRRGERINLLTTHI